MLHDAFGDVRPRGLGKVGQDILGVSFLGLNSHPSRQLFEVFVFFERSRLL